MSFVIPKGSPYTRQLGQAYRGSKYNKPKGKMYRGSPYIHAYGKKATLMLPTDILRIPLKPTKLAAVAPKDIALDHLFHETETRNPKIDIEHTTNIMDTFGPNFIGELDPQVHILEHTPETGDPFHILGLKNDTKAYDDPTTRKALLEKLELHPVYKNITITPELASKLRNQKFQRGLPGAVAVPGLYGLVKGYEDEGIIGAAKGVAAGILPSAALHGLINHLTPATWGHSGVATTAANLLGLLAANKFASLQKLPSLLKKANLNLPTELLDIQENLPPMVKPKSPIETPSLELDKIIEKLIAKKPTHTLEDLLKAGLATKKATLTSSQPLAHPSEIPEIHPRGILRKILPPTKSKKENKPEEKKKKAAPNLAKIETGFEKLWQLGKNKLIEEFPSGRTIPLWDATMNLIKKFRTVPNMEDKNLVRYMDQYVQKTYGRHAETVKEHMNQIGGLLPNNVDITTGEKQLKSMAPLEDFIIRKTSAAKFQEALAKQATEYNIDLTQHDALKHIPFLMSVAMQLN